MQPRGSITGRLTFSWAEFSGSLGDLGLFIPLVVAMASVGRLDLGTILVAAGAMNVATGWFFRQPIPVQPMKAIAAVAITEGLTRGELMASGIIMGALLLAVGLTGMIGAMDRVIPRPLVRGIHLGVGLKLAAKGVDWVFELPVWGWDGVAVAVLTALVLLWLVARRKSGLFFVFCAGFALIYLENPAAYEGIGLTLAGQQIGWPAAADWSGGLLRGAVPQLPLTLLNSVVAVCALSADYFPRRGVSPKRMAVSVGLMNLVCSPFGGIPMCHGAGGLAAQYRFGARTGGSVVILGLAKILVGVAFGGALLGLLGSYPNAILGPMLVFAGVELARACADSVDESVALSAVLLTAAAILGSNTFVGFVVGAAFHLLVTRVRARRNAGA
jgi:MFS superfamily sulfate permease-like transporter